MGIQIIINCAQIIKRICFQQTFAVFFEGTNKNTVPLMAVPMCRTKIKPKIQIFQLQYIFPDKYQQNCGFWFVKRFLSQSLCSSQSPTGTSFVAVPRDSPHVKSSCGPKQESYQGNLITATPVIHRLCLPSP